MNKRRIIKKRSENRRDYNIYILDRRCLNNYFSQKGSNYF